MEEFENTLIYQISQLDLRLLNLNLQNLWTLPLKNLICLNLQEGNFL
jgi:hypothetical protein